MLYVQAAIVPPTGKALPYMFFWKHIVKKFGNLVESVLPIRLI